MDLLSLLRLVARHWRITGPAALLALLGVFATLPSPSYRSSGSFLLLNPPAAPEAETTLESTAPENPYARFNDLSVVAEVLQRIMAGDSTKEVLKRAGVTDYVVATNRDNRSPVIEVTADEVSAKQAMRSAEVVLSEVEAVLAERQAADGSDPRYFITTVELETPTTARVLYGSTVRAAIATLAVGALCLLGLALLAEAVTQRRRRRSTPTVGPVVSESASGGTGPRNSNGSSTGGGAEVVPVLQLSRSDSSRETPAQQTPWRTKTTRQKAAGEPRTDTSDPGTDSGDSQATTGRDP